MAAAAPDDDINALAKGGRTNILGFLLRLAARLPFLFIAGRSYGPDLVGRFALAVVVVEFAAQLATLGLKRGLAQALSSAEDRPHAHVVWDAMTVAGVASAIASVILFVFPEILFPSGGVGPLERYLPLVVFTTAWTEISLAALAYRRNLRAAVTARAVLEPWTISIAAFVFSFVTKHEGLVLSYMLSMMVALAASLVPFVRSYGLPVGWRPHPGRLWDLARYNVPLAGADAIEWATRNVDRAILGYLFEPRVVGIYYMAVQVASLPGKLKTSFDPILGPVITHSLAIGDKAAVAHQVRQVGFWIITAQAGLALVGSIPGKAVMGVVGPQFVAGTAAMAFLLFAEVAASTGAVCESALVYVSRHVNLMISIGALAFQIALSFGLILLMRALDWPPNWQAAGPAVALLVAMGASSIVKSELLARLLGAPTRGWRWQLLAAAAAAVAVGTIFTSLPHRFEWAQLIIGVPVIAATYLFVLWKTAFDDEDKALLRRTPAPKVAAA
ncbi:lipopolysaccharide biosynthesis protein [Sphingomonas immobilis]|uniref:lipopolysaccharide biosynthesis protein n=1 Tax=Sphingomonas immobilis TaxID=3063997 RepID=UPI00272A794F|nr:oligosaccharide flippase family protein [Sphingomonas sp. CA1-15]